ncbi:MAG: UvrD-helicase domain-containing protein [Candidatus Thermoplasmatota archaeon]|nr:UvrD-helicase domain-containing protein [Candidatus Thermoplasmatota archaeon]
MRGGPFGAVRLQGEVLSIRQYLQKEGRLMELTDPQRRSLDTTKHIAVTAGAGSGKTHILVERYLNILKEEESTGPRNILALTFTEKAASEMKDRVRREVRKMAAEHGGRWFDVTEELDRSDISTIHSFCTRLVRTLPVPAGIDPDFRVISETGASEILGEILNEMFTVEWEGSSSLRRLLVDYGMNSTVQMLKGLLRESGRTSLPLGSKEFEELSLRSLENALSEKLGAAENDLVSVADALEEIRRIPLPAASRDRALELIVRMNPLMDAGRSPRKLMSALNSNMELFLTARGDLRRSGNLGSLGVWKGDLGRLREAFSRIFSFVHNHRNILPFAADEDLSTRAAGKVSDLMVVFRRVSDMFASRKMEENGLDFDDMISLALSLLERNEEGILDTLRARYKHLLVDEFQDTDPRQWKLVDLLWSGGRNSKLFIVGDPKQSIYGFRSADVRLFLLAQKTLDGHASGEKVVLDRNFRSRREIMDVVNGIFPAIMGDGSEKWGVPFDPLEANRGGGGSVKLVGVLGKMGSERREGEEAARIIKKAVGTWLVDDDGEDRPLRYSDIAILVPTRYGFDNYVDGLRGHDVPFQVYKGKGFFERQEVADVLDLMSFVTNINDDLALASVLKGPFFGFSDEDLFRISRQRGATLFNRLSMLPEEFGEDHALLSRFVLMSKALPPHMALRSILELSCIYATAGGRREARNLDRVVEWAMEEHSVSSMFDLCRRLRRMIDEPPKEGEPPLSVGEDSVTMMTIHSAKGLEWPMVLVLGMNHEGGGGPRPPFLLDPDNGVSLLVADHSTGKFVKTPPWTVSEEECSLKEKEERKRLLYVAMTRARDHLVMSGMVPMTKDGVELPPRGMFGMVWEGMGLTVPDLDEGCKMVNGVPVSLTPVRPDDISEDEAEDMSYTEIQAAEGPPMSLLSDVEPVGSSYLLSPSRLLEEQEVEELYPADVSIVSSDIPPDEFGDMVHMVLQGIPIDRVVAEFGWKDRKDDVLEAVERIASSKGSHDAVEMFHEVELVARIKDRSGKEIPVLGRMDLLEVLGNGELRIVDYKTGMRKKTHLEQLEAYREMLGKLVKGKIGTKVVYSRDEDTT